jgi:hypothetical protein
MIDAPSHLYDCCRLQGAARGICNTFARGATVISRFVVGTLMVDYGPPGAIWLTSWWCRSWRYIFGAQSRRAAHWKGSFRDPRQRFPLKSAVTCEAEGDWGNKRRRHGL